MIARASYFDEVIIYLVICSCARLVPLHRRSAATKQFCYTVVQTVAAADKFDKINVRQCAAAVTYAG